MTKEPQYQLRIAEQDDILEITITGEVTANNVNELQKDVFTAMKKANFKTLLVDVRSLKGRLGVVEAYNRVRNYPANAFKGKTAVVDLEENKEYQLFAATTSQNAGYNNRAFFNIEDARDWLKDPNP